jgi:hypothetical protein
MNPALCFLFLGLFSYDSLVGPYLCDGKNRDRPHLHQCFGLKTVGTRGHQTSYFVTGSNCECVKMTGV